MTRISFIVPTYNRASYLGEALGAIARQMSADDELLVLDDGSTDGTEAAVRAAVPEARYVRQPNRGKSAALNHALALTHGRFVWICDDDDVLRPGAVALLFAKLSPQADFILGRHGRFRDVNGTRHDLGTGYWPDLASGSVLRHMLEDSFVMQNATLIRRAALDLVGPFDETLARSIDYDMFVRLALHCRADHVDDVIFDQRKHDGARGSGAALHDASAAMTVWNEWDRRVFDKLVATTPHSLYEGLFDGDDVLVRRAAWLQRACIDTRHDRCAAAVDHLAAAAEIAPERPLHAVERNICRRVLNGKHGFQGLFSRPVAERLARVLRRGRLGPVMGWTIASGGRWMLRRGGQEHRRAAWRFFRLVALATSGRGARALIARPGQPDAALFERSEPPLLPLAR